MSTLEELLDRLDATRERTLVALEILPDEALLAPGAVGRWSVADLLSILTAWDAEVVTGLMRLKAGKPPERLLAAVRNPNVYNAQRYQEAQGRDLDVIFNDFQGARLHLEEWLSELSERALAEPSHYKALGGVALGRLIAEATLEHEARYLPFLTAVAERWETAGQPEEVEIVPEGGDSFLPLDTIGILDIGSADDPEEPDDDHSDLA